MMKFYLVLAFLGLSVSYAIAQKLPSETENATARIFPTYAKVYSAPAQDAAVTDSLAANRVVQISVDEEQTAADWFSVSYHAGKQNKKGYVRADALASAMVVSGNFQVLFGKFSGEKPEIANNRAAVKVYENRILVAETDFEFAADAFSVSKILLGNHRNLKNVLLTIKVTGTAHQNQTVTYEQNMLVTKSKELIMLPLLKTVEQPYFSHRETLHFPQSPGGGTSILKIKKESSDQNTDNGSEESSISETIYVWDGSGLRIN